MGRMRERFTVREVKSMEAMEEALGGGLSRPPSD